MGTEVLRPQDCLIQRIRVAPAVFHRRKNYNGNGNGYPKPNYNSNRKPVVRSDQRKRSPEPTISNRSTSTGDLRTKPLKNNLVMGQVTILKRGELFENKNRPNQVPLKKNSDPEIVPKQIRMSPSAGSVGGFLPDMYAGSAFSVSPSPSALPLPSFFNKGARSVDDSATRDLRRLLRLD